MKKLTIIALFAALGFVSCKDTKTEATTTDVTTTEQTTTNAVPTDEHAGHDHDAHAGHNHGPEGNDHGATTTATKAGMNPAHGQPGHRCDIAVGAPLDSPAERQVPQQTSAAPSQGGFLGGSSATPQQAAPQQAAPQQAMPAQQTAAGMKGKPNPAHGQPGHRCDISVGQPLP